MFVYAQCSVLPIFSRYSIIIYHNIMTSPNGKTKQDYDFLVKLVILGDSSVGKTNILLNFTGDGFKKGHMPTIGVDFKVKTLDIQGKKMKMQLWDTAGQERFKTITQTYYKGASGIVMVYAVNDRKSFNNVSSWMSQIQQFHDDGLPKILVGNKCDLQMERVVSSQQGKIMADDYGIPFIETSAKESININQTFLQLGRLIVQREGTRPKNYQNVQINWDGNQQEKKKKCCG